MVKWCYTSLKANSYTDFIIYVDDPLPVNPCHPSPCGPFSECRDRNGYAICTCLSNYIGSPPACRPECSVSTDCAPDKACRNRKCIDPCIGTCGSNARCNTVNHSPICSCPSGYSGDPFKRCFVFESRFQDLFFIGGYTDANLFLEPPIIEDYSDPCTPSPCGPYSECRDVNGVPSCSCLPNYIGRAPNCRPECVSNSECPSNLACFNEKCRDPCPGSCGFSAQCTVVSHTPSCSCNIGYTGDPFTECHEIPSKK